MNAEVAAPTPAAGDRGEAVSVWLVEDNETYRRAIERAVNHTGSLRCGGSFGTCEAALERLRRENPPQVILLDIGLPGMSGLDGIGQFKALSATTHIIILTAFEDTDKIFKAICAGASGYLLKASTAHYIARAIHEVLEGGAPMTPQIAKSVLGLFSKMATPAPSPDQGLSQREKETLEYLAQGLATKEIADRLNLSIHTVDTHLRNIYRKLHVNSRAGAVGKVLRATPR